MKDNHIEKLFVDFNGGVFRGAQVKVAKALGTTDVSVNRWIKGTAKPSPDFILKMTKLFKKSEEEIKELFSIDEKLPWTKLSTMPFKMLPLLAALPAGDGQFFEDEKLGDLPFPLEIINGADYLIRCTGDSMYPTIQKGDLLFVKATKTPISGKIMIIGTEEGFTIKRVVKTKEGYDFKADNPNYKCNGKLLKIRGLVVNFLRNMI